MSGSPKPELLEIPGAEGLSVDFLTNLMNQTITPQNVPQLNVGPAQQIAGLNVGPAQNIPLQQVAGMTGIEQTVQGMLGKYLGTSATGGEAYKAGMGELQKTLGGEFYDPKTSDFWSGYREYSEMEQEKGIAAVRRRGQLGGGLRSTPSARAEGEYIGEMGARRTMMLGGLYEKERDRRTGAVGQALGYAGLEETGKATRLQLGSAIGALPRTIKDREYQAAYQQQYGQSSADFARQQRQNQSTYVQALGQGQANFAQQQASNQAVFAQQSGQGQAEYASQLAEIGIQSGAAGALMPQWFVPGQDNTAGGMLGLLGSIIGGK